MLGDFTASKEAIKGEIRIKRRVLFAGTFYQYYTLNFSSHFTVKEKIKESKREREREAVKNLLRMEG